MNGELMSKVLSQPLMAALKVLLHVKVWAADVHNWPMPKCN